MVNQHSTITNIQDYLENADVFDNVKAFHNERQGLVIYEAYGDDDLTTEKLKQDEDVAMVFSTYGMKVEEREDTHGETYYRFECNESFLIDDL